MPSARVSKSALLLAATAGLFACSTDDPPVDGPLAPKVSAFIAEPETVGLNGVTTLTWQVLDATTVSIDIEGGANLVASTSQLFGTVDTPPLAATTTFVLTAVNGDQTVTAMVTVVVDVQPIESAVILGFSADPTTVNPGNGTLLSWTTMRAQSGSLLANGVEVWAIPAANLASGSYAQNLTVPTTFTLSVRGTDGIDVTQDVTVGVVDVPMPVIVSFTAMPGTITQGEASSLAWTVTGADSVVVAGPVSGQVYSGANLTGSVNVQPDATEVFTLTARAGAVSVTAMVTVTVMPLGARIVSFIATPRNVIAGGSSELSWEVVDAPGGVEISDPTGVVLTSSATVGRLTVTVNDTTTYTLRAINPIADATAALDVTVVTAAPVIVYLLSDAALVGRGDTVELSWRTTGADSIRILTDGFEVYTSVANAPLGTYDAVVPSLVTDFTLEATNILGTSSFTVRVFAHDLPVIDVFTAFPVALAGTTTVTLAWSVTSASELELHQDGAPLPGFTPVDTGTTAGTLTGTIDVVVAQASVFELIARSAAGEVRATRTVAPAVPELEPNNTASTAVALPAGGGVAAGELNPGGDEDWYALPVSQGGYVIAETSDGAGGCLTDTYLSLIAPDGVTVLFNNDDINFPANPCSGINPFIDFAATNLEAGTYYLRVRGYDGATVGPYVLTAASYPAACGNGLIELAAPSPEECDDGNTNNNDGCSAACLIEPTGLYTAPGPEVTLPGVLSPAGDIDYFRITVTSTSYLGAETFAPSAALGTCTGVDTVIFLLDAELRVLGSDDEDGVDSCSRIDLADAFARVGPGTYYLAVVEYFDAVVPAYEVVFRSAAADICGNGVVETALAEDCDDGNTAPGDGCSATCTSEINAIEQVEPNDTAATANDLGTLAVPSLTEVHGAIFPADERDFVRFTLAGPANVTINTYELLGQVDNSCPNDTQLWLYNAQPADPDAQDNITEPALVEYDDDDGFGTCSWIGGEDVLPVPIALAAGTYYLQIRSYNGSYEIPSYYVHIALQ